MMDDYAFLQGAGSMVSSAALWTCTRCGNVVADKQLHDEVNHPEEGTDAQAEV